MRSITNLSNTDSPSSDYPFGRVRDKTISIQGTPVDEKLTGDMTQFFNKLMDYAGVTPNELPDNEYSGFQLMEALMALMGGVKTKIIEIGAWDMDATATKLVAHGLDVGPGFVNIQSVSAIIRNDNSSTTTEFSGNSIDYIRLNTTAVDMGRTASGIFDSTGYDDIGINRGFIVIRYTEAL